jgi:hypothetical protein
MNNHPNAMFTKIDGYWFKSWTEAKFYMLASTLELGPCYEPEGFLLPIGIGYRPDFYLETVRTWVEVKATKFSPEERQKCVDLVELTGKPCLMVAGISDFNNFRIILVSGGEFSVSLDIGKYAREFQAHMLKVNPPPCSGLEDFSEAYRNAVYAVRAFDHERATPVSPEKLRQIDNEFAETFNKKNDKRNDGLGTSWKGPSN